jgi:hypothetical protein
MLDVVKATGEKEPFNRGKFCTSLQKAGAPTDVANAVCKHVEEKITPGISTSKLYREALRYLVKSNAEVAARYSLYRGVASLGPAGYVFEQYIETILQANGFRTMRDVYVQGACIKHEIDVVAIKGNEHYFVEMKYHNEPGIRTHAPAVLYAWARLEDIAQFENKKEGGGNKHFMWLITNTKFTDTAINYAKCKHLRICGWNYPQTGNLEEMIISKKMYPVTVLPSVTKYMLPELVKRNVILAQDLITYSIDDLKKFGLNDMQARKVAEEVRGLFATGI